MRTGVFIGSNNMPEIGCCWCSIAIWGDFLAANIYRSCDCTKTSWTSWVLRWSWSRFRRDRWLKRTCGKQNCRGRCWSTTRCRCIQPMAWNVAECGTFGARRRGGNMQNCSHGVASFNPPQAMCVNSEVTCLSIPRELCVCTTLVAVLPIGRQFHDCSASFDNRPTPAATTRIDEDGHYFSGSVRAIYSISWPRRILFKR